MFGSIAKFFKRSPAKEQVPPPPPVLPKEAASPSPVAAASPGPRPTPLGTSGDFIVLPFTAILPLVPKELHGRITAQGLAGFNFSFAKKKTLEQLPQGAVKVPFGELRHAAPAGVFISSSSHDGKLIDLPLGEVMGQLGTDFFVRPRGQKRLEVPGDIDDLFGCDGEPLAKMRVLEKNEIPKSAPSARAAVMTAPAPVVAAPRVPFSRPSAAVKPGAPAAPAAPAAPIPFPKKTASSATAVAPAPKKNPFAAPAPVSNGEPALVVSLGAIAEQWPEPIRAEIAQLHLSEATCVLPLAEIEAPLRAGKVSCQWKQIRSWITPPIVSKKTSSHAETSLEMPLRIISRLYLE